jgi:thiol-disulfide isomerase/thioredoxin
MNSFQTNFTKVIDHSKNLENYNQEQLYNTVVDLRTIHGEMIGGFYNNLDKNLNDNEVKLELSFLDSMIDTTRKVLQLAESKFNMQNTNQINIQPTMRGGSKPKYEEFKKNKPILMLFHADWCGHCHHFMPTFEKLRNEYVDKNLLNVVKISDKNKDLISEYEISGYPTIKLYDGNNFHDYDGGRDINSIRDYVNNKLKVSAIKD